MTVVIAISVLCLTVIGYGENRTAGKSVFGERHFTEYLAGDLPLIIAAPHDGRLRPAEIPDRSCGVTTADSNTQDLARLIAMELQKRTGRRLHLVICHLHRSKLDANREITEAAQGNALAEQAWKEHHAFIETACDAAVCQFGVAFFIDLHGHAHSDSRVELGYLYSPLELAGCEEGLNESSFIQSGSLRWIAQRSHLSHNDLLRGPHSLGALLEAQGFPSTPGPRLPLPTEPYFRGSYTVARHCDATRQVCGVQIEANRPFLRDTAENRLRFARALVTALETFFPTLLDITLDGPRTEPVSSRTPSSLSPIAPQP